MTDTRTMERPFTLLGRCDGTANGTEEGTTLILLTDDPSSEIVLCDHHWHENKDRILALGPFYVKDLIREGSP
jgi:hypothetical protein